jgi:hypothetical protein
VHDVWEFAARVAAEGAGIPVARVGLGRGGARRAGRGPYLTSMPAALEDPAVPLPPRTLRFRGDAVPPAAPDAGEPLVYVSFGSVTAGGHLPFYPALYRAAIDALAGLPARFLVTVGEEREHVELGLLPPNVEVERWVPQDEVLHRASAVVTHGGLGSTLGALAHGVPLVVLPLFSARPVASTRRAVARAGAGVALDASATPAAGSTCPPRRRSRGCDPPSSTSSQTLPPPRGAGDRRGDPRPAAGGGRGPRARGPRQLSRPSSTIGSPSRSGGRRAQVADHVPVHGRLVRAAGLRIGAADGEVDGAADLLVEQDRADRAVDAEVRADADLAEARRALVGGERLAR